MPTARRGRRPRARPLTKTTSALITRDIIRCALEPGRAASEVRLAGWGEALAGAKG